MKLRALICSLLMLSQPVIVLAEASQSAMDASAATEHCLQMGHAAEDAAGTASSAEYSTHQFTLAQPTVGDPAMGDHEDCQGACDLCAACVTLLSHSMGLEVLQCRAERVLSVYLPAPARTTELLYRPPIFS